MRISSTMGLEARQQENNSTRGKQAEHPSPCRPSVRPPPHNDDDGTPDVRRNKTKKHFPVSTHLELVSLDDPFPHRFGCLRRLSDGLSRRAVFAHELARRPLHLRRPSRPGRCIIHELRFRTKLGLAAPSVGHFRSQRNNAHRTWPFLNKSNTETGELLLLLRTSDTEGT